MKKLALITIPFIFLVVYIFGKPNPITKEGKKIKSQKEVFDFNLVKDGDLIFQKSHSSQSLAVEKATNSIYSHCGIIFKEDSNYFVLEAVQPVSICELSEWIARGKEKHYVIKRHVLADSLLNKEKVIEMKKIGSAFLGNNYDLTFEWSDSKMYCSELIWKIYKRALNIEIGALQKLEDLNLSDRIVKEKLKERYGNNIPYQETIISPESIFVCKDLKTIKMN
jgi:uncharacterized protein YycO